MPRVKAKTRTTFRKSGARFPAKALRKANRRRKPSSLEVSIHEMLEEEGIPFVKEKTIGRCHADIFLLPRTVIETEGCYYHGCPLCFPSPSKMQKAAIAKDSRRYGFFKKLGFDVIRLWECEVRAEPERIRRMLKSLVAK